MRSEIIAVCNNAVLSRTASPDMLKEKKFKKIRYSLSQYAQKLTETQLYGIALITNN